MRKERGEPQRRKWREKRGKEEKEENVRRERR